MECRSIAVLMKVVPDPDGLFRAEGDGAVSGAHLPQIPSVFDENAVEAALQIKEATGARVTVVTLGAAGSDALLRRMLAMGADDVVLVETGAPLWDSYGAAAQLAAALRALGAFDIVLCGREAADTGAGLVGPMVAQALDLPFLTLVSALRVEADGLHVRRPCEGGHDRYVCQPPFLLTIAGEANRPRMPSVMKMMQAKKLPVQTRMPDMAAPCLPGDEAPPAPARALPVLAGACTLFEGDAATATVQLVAALRAERMIPA